MTILQKWMVERWLLSMMWMLLSLILWRKHRTKRYVFSRPLLMTVHVRHWLINFRQNHFGLDGTCDSQFSFRLTFWSCEYNTEHYSNNNDRDNYYSCSHCQQNFLRCELSAIQTIRLPCIKPTNHITSSYWVLHILRSLFPVADELLAKTDDPTNEYHSTVIVLDVER